MAILPVMAGKAGSMSEMVLVCRGEIGNWCDGGVAGRGRLGVCNSIEEDSIALLLSREFGTVTAPSPKLWCGSTLKSASS